ncbi:hypothetical protein KDK77_10455, partial [bacterium]|nr:hypothetical protein [bacterium]
VQEEIGVKKIFSMLICLSVICVAVNLCHSATTLDGLITLDFFEDTQSGIENRWILDFTVNDVGGSIESFTFTLFFFNGIMDFHNSSNPGSILYEFSYLASGTIPNVFTPILSTKTTANPVPIGTMFSLFLLPNPGLNSIPDEGEPVLDDFDVELHYTDNLGQNHSQNLILNGPIFFAVPEPISISLYSFGTLLLFFMRKKKNH